MTKMDGIIKNEDIENRDISSNVNIKYEDDNSSLRNLIYTIRNQQVMMDSDLAVLYQVETKVLNQAVARNIVRFPERFRFRLTKKEFDVLKSQIVTSKAEYDNLRSQIGMHPVKRTMNKIDSFTTRHTAGSNLLCNHN